MPAPNGLLETALATGAQILVKLGGRMLKQLIKPQAHLRPTFCVSWFSGTEYPCLHFVVRNTTFEPITIETVELAYLTHTLRRAVLQTHSLTRLHQRLKNDHDLPNPFSFDHWHPLYSEEIFIGREPIQPEKALIIRLDIAKWFQIFPAPHASILLHGRVTFQNGLTVHTNRLTWKECCQSDE